MEQNNKYEQKKEQEIIEDLATVSCEEFYGVYFGGYNVEQMS